jgi:hypothetical protein
MDQSLWSSLETPQFQNTIPRDWQLLYEATKNDDGFRGMTGSFRVENGSSYTWSVKAFKKWKKEFQTYFQIVHGQSLTTAIPDPYQREMLYKSLLGMEGYDVFRTGNTTKNLEIDEAILETCIGVSILMK